MRLLRAVCCLGALTTLIFSASCATSQETKMADKNLPADDTSQSNPTEIRRGVPMGGLHGKSRREVYFERMILSIQEDLKGDPQRLQSYIDLYRRELLSNPSLFATDVRAEWRKSDRTVVLKGYVEFEENRRSLVDLFKSLQFESIDDQVEVLPSEALGAQKFAITKAARSLCYDKSQEPRETMTEVLLGDPVFLLKEMDDGYFLTTGVDGYISFIDGAALQRMDAQEFQDYQAGEQAVVLRDVDLAAGDDLPEFIPAGAHLKVVGKSAGGVMVALPGNEKTPIEVAADAVRLVPDGPDEHALAAIKAAEAILGTEYVWGGKSSAGVDCSGLVQRSYLTEGVYLARDAYMQAYAGKLVATRWYRDGLERGDLLYFVGWNGKITHTGIYLGDDKFIEASDTVRYSSFNPADENYREDRDKGLAFAKRLFD